MISMEKATTRIQWDPPLALATVMQPQFPQEQAMPRMHTITQQQHQQSLRGDSVDKGKISPRIDTHIHDFLGIIFLRDPSTHVIVKPNLLWPGSRSCTVSD